MTIEMIIAAYMALVGGAYFCGEKFDKAYASKLKRLGYVSTEPELYGDEAKLENTMNFIKAMICYMIPFINLVPYFIIFGFESFSDSVIKSDLREGKLRQVTPEELNPKPEEGYLQRRIEEVKKFQLEMGKKNVPRTYSELSYDEKIDVLLHELELAYQEKAEAEGIDLTEVEQVYEPMADNTVPKGLKKQLPH